MILGIWEENIRISNVYLNFKKLICKRERNIDLLVYLFIYAFIGWFLYVPRLGFEPTTLMYQDDALPNWATWPGPDVYFHLKIKGRLSFINS